MSRSLKAFFGAVVGRGAKIKSIIVLEVTAKD
jgi:hypothetical protein